MSELTPTPAFEWTFLHRLKYFESIPNRPEVLPKFYRIAGKFGVELNLAIWFEIVNIKSANINYFNFITHAHYTLSDDVIIADDKRQIKISPILLYALFMAPNIMTANIFGYLDMRVLAS